MKKIVLYLLILFFTPLLFAEQPYFLQNWIIPEDFDWTAHQKMPSIPGKKFYQKMKDDGGNLNINFYSYKKSNIDFPPYFTERGLLGWDMTRAEIIEAFKGNENFFTYEYLYPLKENQKYEDGIKFLDIVRIVCREDNHFEFELYFPFKRNQEERNLQKTDYCYLFYVPAGLRAFDDHIPQNEVFEEKYREGWDEYSSLEKKIIGLSYYLALDQNCMSMEYDCTEGVNGKAINPAEKLKKLYSITSKEELLEYLATRREKTVFPEYYEILDLFEKYPGKEVIEIGIEEDYTVTFISKMFFVDTMKDYIGKHGFENYLQSLYLLILRLGEGAGYLTHEESLEYARPLAEELLSHYSSYEDFTAHLAATFSYTGVRYLNHAILAANILINYKDVKKYIPLEEINFNGSDADKPLSFFDSYYKPSGEAFWWCKIQNEAEKKDGKELTTIKYELSKWGKVPALTSLISQIRPKKFDSSKDEEPSKFFIQNYKETWKKLPVNEQYAIAFSSNLFELNQQYHLDFENKVKLSDKSSNSKKLLKDSWSIESYEDLIATFNSLEEYGHSGAYQALSDLIDKHPEESPMQIAAAENLSITDTTRLHFVYDTRDLLGEHGIEAWDEGRQITILRWGIASGYISADEAMTLIEPLIERICDDYITFDDYICHYIMGRQFYALYEGNYEELGEKAKEAAVSARAYIPFYDIKFTSENADPDPMDYQYCLYTPSDYTLKWEEIVSMYKEKYTEETIDKLVQIENEMPDCKNLVFFWHLQMLNYFNKYDEVISFVENNLPYLNSLSEDSEVYGNSFYYYMIALNNTCNPKEALFLYDSLPENLKKNIYYYDQFAYASYLMINLSTSQDEMDFYKKQAINSLRLLKDLDYNIGARLQGWLEAVER